VDPCCRRLPAVLASLVVLGLLFAGGATPAWAHPRQAQPVAVVQPVAVEQPGPAAIPGAPLVAAAPALNTVPAWAALGLLLALALALSAPRRTLVGALALVLVVLAAETGVHSVHHLADPQAAAECVVAVASAQVHGTAQAIAVYDLHVFTPVAAVLAPEPDRPGARLLRPDEGRAPPAA
jgi:hypothetical protein